MLLLMWSLRGVCGNMWELNVKTHHRYGTMEKSNGKQGLRNKNEYEDGGFTQTHYCYFPGAFIIYR